MGCGASSSGDSNIQYENGKPTVEGDQVHKCFDKDNGLLFRIVDKKQKTWYYYNDTKEYDMHVEVTFKKGCKITAAGNTQLEQLSNGDWKASVIVQPLATQPFIRGKVNGFTSKMKAVADPERPDA